MKPDWGNRIYFSLKVSGSSRTPEEINALLGVDATSAKPANHRRPSLWLLESGFFVSEDLHEPISFAALLNRISKSAFRLIRTKFDVSFYCVIETTDWNYEYEVPLCIVQSTTRLGLGLKLDFYKFSKASIRRLNKKAASREQADPLSKPPDGGTSGGHSGASLDKR